MTRPVSAPADTFTPTLRALADAGYSHDTIGAAAGVSAGTIQNIIAGNVTRVKAGTAHALTTLTHQACLLAAPPDRHVPAIGTTRRLQALAWTGWDTGRIARATGLATSQTSRHSRGYHRTIDARAARAVADLYDTGWTGPPAPTTRHEKAAVTTARRTARARGWHGPLAWDDIDDPAATPDFGVMAGRPNKKVWLEDVEWLLDSGVTNPEYLASRLGVTANTLLVAARRAGRGDLLVRLQRGVAS